MLPPFSIVIPCFNEEARIGQTLRVTLDYLATNAPESELIVVNDGSTDATAAIARERLNSAQVATRLMSSFFIGRNVRVFGSAKFPCDGITLKSAKLVFSATACGCYAKSSRCEHKRSLTKVERVVLNALANNCGFAA